MNKLMYSLLASAFVVLAVGSTSSVAAAEEPIDWNYQIAHQRSVEAVNWAIPAVGMLNFREACFFDSALSEDAKSERYTIL